MSSPVRGGELSPQCVMFLKYSQVLFDSSSTQQLRHEADEWLGQFQKVQEAWLVVDEALRTPQMDSRVVFLAAQTLNRKIRYDRYQLGFHESTWQSLRASVVSHLMRYSASSIVATQLSLALVALLIQMESWNHALPELVNGLSHSPNVLLECLKLIPEEADDPSLDVSTPRRYAFKMEMLDFAPHILVVLKQAAHLVSLILLQECLTSWVAHTNVPLTELIHSQLLDSAVSVLSAMPTQESREFDSSAALLIEACYAYRDEPEFLQFLVPRLSHMRANFATTSVPGYKSALARLFSNAAEAFLGFSLDLSLTLSTDITTLALVVFADGDFYISRKSTFFWMDYLSQLSFPAPPSLHHLLEVIFQTCCMRMILPAGEEEEDGEDEEEDVEMESDFDQHRHEVGTILQHVAYVGGQDFLHSVIQPQLISSCQRFASSPKEFFALMLVAQQLGLYFTNPGVSDLLQICFQVANSQPKIQRQTLLLLESLVDSHVAHHPSLYLEPTLQFVLRSLSMCPGAASACFKKLCLNELLAPHLVSLLPDFLLHSALVECRNTSSNKRLHSKLDIIEALTRLYVSMSRTNGTTHIQLMALLDSIAVPLWEQISRGISLSNRVELIAGLKGMAMCVQASTGSGVEEIPHQLLLSKLWLILPSFLTVEEECTEAIIGLIKHAFRTYPQACKERGTQVLDFMVNRFNAKPSSGWLYLAGAFFQSYFDCPELLPHFSQVFHFFSNRSLELVLTSPEAFVIHPDFVDDLYYFANRVVEKVPDVFLLDTPSFLRLFGMAAEVGVLLEHGDAFRSVAVFVDNAIGLLGSTTQYNHIVIQALELHGQTLVRKLIHGLSVQVPELVGDQREPNGTIVHMLFALFEFWLEARFERAVNQALQEEVHLSSEMRATFAKDFSQAAIETGLHQVTTICCEFAETARRRMKRAVKE